MSKKVQVSSASSQFIVRGGEKKGKYIKIRATLSATGRKYAWTPYRQQAIALTYRQAQGVARRYGKDAEIVRIG